MKIEETIATFAIDGAFKSAVPYGNGHINDTYLAEFESGDGTKRYILQRLNKNVFPYTRELMSNVFDVTRYLADVVAARGGDVNRECLNIVPTRGGEAYYVDADGDFWRCYVFIENTDCYSIIGDKSIFGDSGRAFGKFIRELEGFDATRLFEVIPNFHNTRDRYGKFCAALLKNSSSRKDAAADEIAFVQDRKDYCGIIVDALAEGEIPTRVTHNDTKLNNVLIDKADGKAICVIDLDTIMPGSLLYDFGDSCRFGCSTAPEDEKDLSKVDFSLELYDAYCEGFLDGIGEAITPAEVKMLWQGALLMTLECGMRFLTDYLDGDVYFKTAYPEHNLVRCRTQFKLVRRIEAQKDEMAAIAVRHSRI